MVTTPRDGYLTTSPRGEASGAHILLELADRPVGLAIWRVFRLLTLWMGEPPESRRGLLDADKVHAALLATAGDQPFDPEDPRGALVFILGEITASQPDLRRAARACLAVADWALGAGAEDTALAFARAAALVGQNARYAWLAGRLHREHNQALQAEIWCQVAYSLAAREHDWEIGARALMSWGHVHLNVGRYAKAKRLFERAVATAHRFKLPDREGEAHHYLFTVARAVSDRSSADFHSRAAAALYGPEHPTLPNFAHDLATYWMDSGDYPHALQVLLALVGEPSIESYPLQLLFAGSAMRAAGACGQNATYDALRRRFEALCVECPTSPFYAQALLHAGRGAALLLRWTAAEDLTLKALAAARATGQHDTMFAAEQLLMEVRELHPFKRVVHENPENAEATRVTVQSLSERLSGVGASLAST
ncbi:hypothetical protein [Longimicrobium sp.]|uniref:hypothetical protein n=1 Tax=Longimicrobium sp. TaxID=2029185 RepID=UPI002BE06FE8|nr:hypothetical protein [Longimicrobium sp.]HSU12488.1 hypothetical protein [Longimicrobium sp.]